MKGNHISSGQPLWRGSQKKFQEKIDEKWPAPRWIAAFLRGVHP